MMRFLFKSGYLELGGQFDNPFMKILFTLLVLCFALNANAGTYLLLSQTNVFAAGITNEAKAYADTKAPLASPPLTGNPTINGQSMETQLTNKVDVTLTTDQSMSGRLLTPSLTIGALAVSRSTLTHAAGNVVANFADTNRYRLSAITGNVAVVTQNLVAGKVYDLLIIGTSTNSTFTAPAWCWPVGIAAPTTIVAATTNKLTLEANGTTDSSVLACFVQFQ